MTLAFCAACGSSNDLQHHHLVTRGEGGGNANRVYNTGGKAA